VVLKWRGGYKTHTNIYPTINHLFHTYKGISLFITRVVMCSSQNITVQTCWHKHKCSICISLTSHYDQLMEPLLTSYYTLQSRSNVEHDEITKKHITRMCHLYPTSVININPNIHCELLEPSVPKRSEDHDNSH
jgi:hypothetical protein